MAAAESAISYKRVYVWELPVRLYHWINALAITVLVATGFLIGNPQAIFWSNEAYQQYWFGIVRFFHFAFAYIFLFNMVFRIYWGFVGNRYARWNRFIPVTRFAWRDLWETIKVDILQFKPKGRSVIGHNMLAGIAYTGTFVLFLAQLVTGFALYSSMSEAFIPRLFTWIVPILGGDAWVRQWHHIFTWGFAVFVMIHIYLVFYHDYVEGRGTTSSIIGGWKFEREDEIEERNR